MIPARLTPTAAPPTPSVDLHNLAFFRNGVYDVATGEFRDREPGLNPPFVLPYDYVAKADEPKTWLKFLDSVFGQGYESTTVQEWAGRLLTCNNHYSRILTLTGPEKPARVILHVLRLLAGTENSLETKLSKYDLEQFVGKAFAIFFDASAEALVNTDLPLRTITKDFGGLPTRFAIHTDTLPEDNWIHDKLLVVKLIDKCAKTLTPGSLDMILGACRGELPGIVLWALEGAQRLREFGGRFPR